MRHIFNRKTVGGGFFAALLLLIFFSKTIYSYRLPSVTAASPSNGKLSKLELVSGVADWAKLETLFAAVGGTVDEVLVQEGDKVKEGQELMQLSFDRQDAQQRLNELANNRGKLYVDMENITLKLATVERYIQELENDSYREDSISEYELDQVALDISQARQNLKKLRDMRDEGEATDMEVDEARYQLQSLYLKQDNLKEQLAQQQEKAELGREDWEKQRASKLADYQDEKNALALDLKNKNLDLSSLSLQEEPYRDALERFEENAVVCAPYDGIVTDLFITKGETVANAQKLAALGVGSEFYVECSVSLDNNFISPGDTCKLGNTSKSLEGTVSTVTPTHQGKTVRVAVSSQDIAAGETFDIRFQQNSDVSYTLVPNGALNQDNDGYFLWQIKRRDSVLGKEFYVERLGVYIGDSDDTHTVVVQGISFFEPVVLLSDKGLTAGTVISVENAGDFFDL